MAARMKILIIEKDVQTWVSISEFFAPKGYTVVAVTRASAAIQCTPLENLACVFLAIRLLDRDGRSLLRRLRHAHPEVPVVLLTVQSSSRILPERHTPGTRRWVDTPISPRALEACLADISLPAGSIETLTS